MVKIQLDVSEDLNKKIKLYSIEYDFNKKQLAVIDILEKKLNK